MNPALTPQLIQACRSGDLHGARSLLTRGAHVRAGNHHALHWAAGEGHYSITQLLLDHGADLHSQNEKALRSACWNGHSAGVQLLLSRGADSHAQENEAFFLVAKQGHLSILKILLAQTPRHAMQYRGLKTKLFFRPLLMNNSS